METDRFERSVEFTARMIDVKCKPFPAIIPIKKHSIIGHYTIIKQKADREKPIIVRNQFRALKL